MLITCVVTAVRITNAQYVIRPCHPRIWITHDCDLNGDDDFDDPGERGNIHEIRERCLNGSAKQYYEAYKQKAEGGNMLAQAFVYQITEDPSYAKRAIEQLKNVTKITGRHPEKYILTFDWTYDQMTEEDKQVIVNNWVQNNLGGSDGSNYEQALQEYYQTGRIPGDIFLNLEYHQFSYFPLGLALYGDWEGAEAYIKFNDIVYAQEALKIFENLFPDGEWWEGLGYYRHTIPHVIKYLKALKTTTGIDRFKDSNFFRNTPYFVMYNTRPDYTYARWNDIGANDFEKWEMRRYVFLPLNYEYHDPYVQWFINHYLDISPKQVSIYDVLFYDGTIPEKSLTELPQAMHFRGTGVIAMRSGWEIGSYDNPSSDTYTIFKSGDMYSHSHTHYDANSFVIYKDGALAIDSGIYKGGCSHEFNYSQRTIAHNSITVYNPDETLHSLYRSNEGGQEVLYTRLARLGEARPNSYNDWMTRKEVFQGGDILNFEETPNYTYILGDATKAYQPGKLSLFTRQFIWLKPNYVVIFDKVNAVSYTHLTLPTKA